MKKNNQSNYLLLLLLPVFLIGCKDVFEENITNKQLTINAPMDGAKSLVYKQLFWWNKLEGATQYSIQIATPSFDSLVSIVVDTIVLDTDKFYKTLAPGKYQWRIRAENGNYKTNYQTYTLTMLVSPLDQQEINLTAPANNTYYGISHGATIDFSWEELPGATTYVINIDTVSGNFGSSMVLNDEVDVNSYSYTLPSGGDYKWRIKAKDDDGNETSWSSVYKTGYYGTKPSTPTLSLATASGSNVNFSWNTVATAKTYTLHLYYAVGDTNKVGTDTYPVTAPTTNTNVTITDVSSGGQVYWRVSATDKAGNVSDRSFRKSITMP